MGRLADVNLGLVRQTYRDLSGLIGPVAQVGSENLARIERTRAFLAEIDRTAGTGRVTAVTSNRSAQDSVSQVIP